MASLFPPQKADFGGETLTGTSARLTRNVDSLPEFWLSASWILISNIATEFFSIIFHLSNHLDFMHLKLLLYVG